MTTIAFKDGILAADSGVFQSGRWCGSADKLIRASDGGMAAVAGSLVDTEVVRSALKEQETGGGFDISDDSEALVIRPDGQVYNAFTNSRICFVDGPFHALGSGFDIAFGAMAAGASALEAVKIAAEYDVNTRGPFQTMEIER